MSDFYNIATGNWNAASSWSNSSGGDPGESTPGVGDNVIFDENPTLSPKYLLSETVVTDAVALGGTKEMTMAEFEAVVQEL